MKEAIVAFELTMPHNNAWNGQWSGACNRYIKFRKFGRSKAAHEKADTLLEKQNHYYNFGDGWGANVNIFKVETKERNKLAKESAGFCGYDWMIDSIIHFGDIRTDEIPKPEIKPVRIIKTECCGEDKNNGEWRIPF